MDKIVKLSLIALLVILMAALVMLFGCTSSGQPQAGPQDGDQPQQQGGAGYQGGNDRGFGNRSNFGNLTAEQRQQMFGQRLKEAAAACDGKTAGDSCVMQSPRGNRTSTCENQNGTLMCAGGFGRGGFGNRTAPN